MWGWKRKYVLSIDRHLQVEREERRHHVQHQCLVLLGVIKKTHLHKTLYVAHVGITIKIDNVQYLLALTEETQVTQLPLQLEPSAKRYQRTDVSNVKNTRERRYLDCNLHICYLRDEGSKLRIQNRSQSKQFHNSHNQLEPKSDNERRCAE